MAAGGGQHHRAARGVPVGYRCMRRTAGDRTSTRSKSKITPQNHGPVSQLAEQSDRRRADARRTSSGSRRSRSSHDLWVISDEAYEDVVFDGEHVSIASLPGMYERTIPLYTFSKSYAMTGLRLGYVAIRDEAIRERAKKILFYTASNVASVVQFGGIGALEGIAGLHRGVPRRSCARGAISSIAASARRPAASSRARRRPARSTRSCKIDPRWTGGSSVATAESLSWRMVEHLIKEAASAAFLAWTSVRTVRATCVSASRAIARELAGALESMKRSSGVTRGAESLALRPRTRR